MATAHTRCRDHAGRHRSCFVSGAKGRSGCVGTARHYNSAHLYGQAPWSRPALLTIVLFTAGCSHHTDMTRPSTQDNFGVQMAKMSLWREALFRFRRAVEINPSDPMAHNNLAVAYEANGDFDSARKEYLEALKLDRSNQYIQKNYSRFVEFLSRNRKRQQKETRTASTSPAAPIAAAPQASGTAVPAAADASQPAPPPIVPSPTTQPPTTQTAAPP